MSLDRFAARNRWLAGAAAAVIVMTPILAEARPGGGKSFGSRGSQTYSTPAPTRTAPNAAQPMERTMTPNQGTPAPGINNAPRPATNAVGGPQAAAAPSFGRSLMMGLGAGLLGAGLFGLLSGSGLFGGLSGIASFLGLVLQAALIAGAIYLVVRFFRRRREEQASFGQPAMAGAAAGPMPGAPMARQAYDAPPAGSAGFGGPAPAGPTIGQVELTEADFNLFEQRLKETMDAYSREDLAALRAFATPEMVGYFAEDIAENARKGLIDVTKDVKLLQGDLSESWSEDGQDYATVAMRFSFLNTLSERAGGRIVEGHATEQQEATELWTFTRKPGEDWKLSAIQQTV